MTKDEIIEMALSVVPKNDREEAQNGNILMLTFNEIKAFAKLVAAKEREECAKVCEELPAPNFYSDTDQSMWDITSMDCAEAIRARGQA